MEICEAHQWVDTGGQLCCWPPIKVYECGVCGQIGNLHARKPWNHTIPLVYDMADMEYQRKENGHTA